MSQIPPVGMKFRLLGVSLQNMIVGHDRELVRAPAKKDYNYNDDSWFTLEESEKEGYFRILHCTTGNPLTGGKKHKNRAFLYVDEEKYDDQLWRLKFGDETQFQVINYCDEAKLFLRDHDSDIDIGVYPDGRNYDDQFFEFYFEELEFVSLDYKLDEGKILTQTPQVITSKTFPNKSSLVQEDKFSYTYMNTDEHKFTQTRGMKMTTKLGIEVSAGIPKVADGKVSFEVGFEIEMSFTTETVKKETKKMEFEFPVKVAPWKKAKASVVVTKAKLDVPYVLTLKGKGTDSEVVTSGMWEGVQNYNVRHEIEELDLEESD